ncbi:MFS transporter [Dankookia sp. P2]|uniref:MFS transporter n=1 Tax=Dankookia sp. P2 TaxID=3423955 RepID=UPI003D671B15
MAAPEDSVAAGPAADTRLLLCIAIGQTIGWGTLFSTFALFGAPMEAELGWSRASINAGLTLAMLVSGLAAVPVGQHVDRHGGRRMLAFGAWLGAALLAAWSFAGSLPVYWAIWAGMGLAQAAALWGPAMAVVVTTARDPGRTITGITFMTGFTGTIFVPLGAALIEALGWRHALLVLAVLQLVPGLLALWLLPQPPLRPATAARGGFSLRAAVRRPAFLGLAGCFAAHAFIGIGLGAHAIPLLRRARPAGSLGAADRRAARALPGGGAAGALRARPARHHARRRGAGDSADALRHAGPGAGTPGDRLAGALCAVLGGGRRADDHRPRRGRGRDPGAGGLWRHHRRAERGDGGAAHRGAGADRAHLGGRRRVWAGTLAAGGARLPRRRILRPGGSGPADGRRRDQGLRIRRICSWTRAG